MNFGTMAKFGVGGAAVGMVKGIVDQHNASNFDPNASTDASSYIKNGLLNAASLGLMSAGGYAAFKTIQTTDFKKVAENISGSDLRKSILPTKDDFMKEVNESLNNNGKFKAKYFQESLDEGINERYSGILNANNIDNADSIATQMTNALHKTDYTQEAFEKTKDIATKNGVSDEVFSKMIAYGKKESDSILGPKQEFQPNIFHTPMYAKAYFTNPDKKVMTKRIGAIAGTYGTLAVGGRYLSGGTLTRDNYGQSDIAGVPFI